MWHRAGRCGYPGPHRTKESCLKPTVPMLMQTRTPVLALEFGDRAT